MAVAQGLLILNLLNHCYRRWDILEKSVSCPSCTLVMGLPDHFSSFCPSFLTCSRGGIFGDGRYIINRHYMVWVCIPSHPALHPIPSHPFPSCSVRQRVLLSCIRSWSLSGMTFPHFESWHPRWQWQNFGVTSCCFVNIVRRNIKVYLFTVSYMNLHICMYIHKYKLSSLQNDTVEDISQLVGRMRTASMSLQHPKR